MPEIGSCTDITCDDEIKELYECHCCLRLVCLKHLNGHVEITKQHNRRLDSVRNELNTVVNTLQVIIEDKILTIEREQKLIEQAKECLDAPSSSMDQLQSIFEQIYLTISLDRSDVAEESRISKDDEYSMDINHDFIDIASSDETAESIQDQHVNIVQEEGQQISCRKIFDTCPLTFDGAYGLTQANHSIELCEHGTTRRIELYLHFMYKHHMNKVYAQRLVRAVADEQDPRKIKLFDGNENVIDHFYKVPCPFFNERIKSSQNSEQNVTIPPCRRRLVAFNTLTRHLRLTHKLSDSSAQKIIDGFKKDRTKNDIALAPLTSST